MPEVTSSVLNAGGCSLHFEAHGPDWAGAVEVLAREWSDEEPGPMVGRVVCGAHPGPPPPFAPDLAEEGTRVWTSVPAPHFELDGVRLSMADERTAFVGAETCDARSALERALPVVLGWLLAGGGSWLVHASAFLVPRSGTESSSGVEPGAVVVLGASGAGKSTTAASALHAGFPLLSDDLVALRQGPRTEVRGIPRLVWFPQELGTVDGAGRIVGTDLRRRQAVRPGLTKGWFPLRAVVVLSHGTESSSTVTAISGVDAIRTLWSSHIASLVPSRLRRWFPVAARVAALPSWRLLLGADSRTRLETTATALASLTPTVLSAPLNT
jgi:hypothetical protein